MEQNLVNWAKQRGGTQKSELDRKCWPGPNQQSDFFFFTADTDQNESEAYIFIVFFHKLNQSPMGQTLEELWGKVRIFPDKDRSIPPSWL